MKIRRATALLFALALPAAWLVTGCGVTQGTQPPPPQAAPTQPPPVSIDVGSVSITPRYVALSPGQKVHFTATSSTGGTLQWAVDGIGGGNTGLGTVDSSGDYTAPANPAQSVNFRISASLASSPDKNYAVAVASIIDYGRIYPTSNPQVEQYSLYLPAPGKVTVQFGKTDAYGRSTWGFGPPTPYGGEVNAEVAGLLAQTTYHMQAQVTLDDGATWTDVDHDTFASGLPLTAGLPPATSPITITASGTPQPGIEMWNTILPGDYTQAFATDLQGNVIWTYTYTGSQLDTIQGFHLLPNGDLMLMITYLSSLTQTAVAANPGTIDEVREVDLAGNTIRDLDIDTLNQRLAAAGFKESDGTAYQLKSFHHSAIALPNGHWVLLTDYPKQFATLSGFPKGVTVLGDVIVDVDQNLNPDWVWNSFNHLDINRRPMNFPDWTHSNDLLYSADDHNLLLSIRHQNWIVKLDFNDGQGTGNILWRLGEGGDFKLVGGTDPTDWFYAQHGMDWFTQNTTGIFRLGLMDNGNDRIFPPPTGQINCVPKAPASAQCYSTVPIFEINENNRTATLVSHHVLPPADFSFFGGNVQSMANGDIHANFCAPVTGTLVQELNPTASQVVWQGTTPDANQFRVERWPSLYPGVQW